MSSTNKTTNYNLSQFLGSDKPAWLADYNQDMSKIDTQMKANADSATGADGKADANTTKIGDLTYLSTTAKNNLVAAINEVDSNADTAQGTANTAGTTANQALNTANGLVEYLNVGASNTTITAANMSVTGTGNIGSESNIHIVGNANKTLIKIYGGVSVRNVSQNSTVTVTITNTGLSPDSDITLNGCGILSKEDSRVIFVDALDYTIKQNGDITFTAYTNNASSVVAKFIACIIFVKDFGD
jgi:hypothetical protein